MPCGKKRKRHKIATHKRLFAVPGCFPFSINPLFYSAVLKGPLLFYWMRRNRRLYPRFFWVLPKKG
ncbi:MAG: hypothetical protein EB101_09080 [Chitinophagia bacterium]|nr:hypothetical protein [Chitinophagia bacterium]